MSSTTPDPGDQVGKARTWSPTADTGGSAKDCLGALLALYASIANVQADLDRAVDALRQEGAESSSKRRHAPLDSPSGHQPARVPIRKQSSVSELPPSEVLDRHDFAESAGECTLDGEESKDSITLGGMDCLPGSPDQVNWPASLKVRRAETGGAPELLKRASITQANLSIQDATASWCVLHSDRKRGPQIFTIHPDSYALLGWNLMGALVLSFDIVTVPWMLAWDVFLEGGLFVLALCTTIFWTVDIVINFLAAYQTDGVIVSDLRAIAVRYVKSWFLADTTIVIADWASLLIVSSTQWRVLRFAKAGRLLRMLAMAKIMKLRYIIAELIEEKLSGFAKLAFRVVKLFTVTLLLSHVISCLWYYIGRAAPTDTGARWTQYGISEEGVWYQYVTSVHWAMAQICLGSMEVNGVSTIERIFSIMCIIFGLLFGSTLVSSLSAAMFEVQMDMRETYVKKQMVHRYLREREVEHNLAGQVERHVAEQLAVKEKLVEDKAIPPELLPPSLRSKLRHNLFGRYLSSHPLFRVCNNEDTIFMERFCRKCLDFRQLRNQDDLFSAQKPAECAYFVVAGSLTYTQEPDTSYVQEQVVNEIKVASWIAEAALWSMWVHVGSATAAEATELAELRLDHFQEVLSTSSGTQYHLAELICAYGRQFHKRLVAARPPASQWPDDLQVPMTDWPDIVFHMDEWARVQIGLDAVRSSASPFWKKPASMINNLTSEIQVGKSIVTLNAAGEMERLAVVAVMKVCNGSGQVLAQIAVRSGQEGLKAKCLLPGTKQDHGEEVRSTLNRWLDKKMPFIAPWLEITGIQQHKQVKESSSLGVRTKYIRNVVSMSLNCDFCQGDVLRIPPPVLRETSRATDRSSAAERPSWSRTTSWSEGGFEQRDVFYIVDNPDTSKSDQASIYAWLEEEEYEVLSSPAGERALSQWVGTLDSRLNEALAERARGSRSSDVRARRSSSPYSSHGSRPLEPAERTLDEPPEVQSTPSSPRLSPI